MFITRAREKYTMAEIKHMGKYRILFIVCTYSLQRIVVGGLFVGGALCLMRSIGISSMSFQGTVTYDNRIVAATVVLSMVCAIGGMWIFFRVLSLFPSLSRVAK